MLVLGGNELLNARAPNLGPMPDKIGLPETLHPAPLNTGFGPQMPCKLVMKIQLYNHRQRKLQKHHKANWRCIFSCQSIARTERRAEERVTTGARRERKHRDTERHRETHGTQTAEKEDDEEEE